MADFYRGQRRRLGLLVDTAGRPAGGRWSLDAENRKKLPKGQVPPVPPAVKHDSETEAAMAEIARRFPDHPGCAMDLWLPTDRAGALRWLDRFIAERLIGFGTYEDAISQRGDLLFHSGLSPLMNLGLVTPKEVIERVVARVDEVPLNDLEGFVRQIIGWREFIRGVYQTHGEAMRSNNARNQRRRLTHHWHDGTTGLPPLDDAIDHQLRLGWTHHINRLMVIANLMNLCEIDPSEVYDYFMSYYLDAYDWVMVPNVYGMGLNSDGGVFATKPYICGSNYLLKMSDFRKGDWCNTVDGLYWRFVEKHRSELEMNPRLAVLTRGLDRMDADRRRAIFEAAETFLARFTG